MNIDFEMYSVNDDNSDNVTEENQFLITLRDALETRQRYKQQLQLVNWLLQQAN